MRDYKIIAESTASSLEDRVRKYLEIGYTVTGGAFYADKIWCQVVVLL